MPHASSNLGRSFHEVRSSNLMASLGRSRETKAATMIRESGDPGFRYLRNVREPVSNEDETDTCLDRAAPTRPSG